MTNAGSAALPKEPCPHCLQNDFGRNLDEVLYPAGRLLINPRIGRPVPGALPTQRRHGGSTLVCCSHDSHHGTGVVWSEVTSSSLPEK